MASEIRVDKITHTAGVGTITPSPTGVHVAGIITGTTFSGSGASLTSLPAAQLSGTLPAISGANLTNLAAANLTGTIADARFPATLPAASAENLTSIPAANVTGTLPALTAANLTNIPAANIVGLATAGFNRSGGFPEGITMADSWRIHTDFTNNATPINSNWERSDVSPWEGYLGSAGLTESSGVFTFPSTGWYYVHYSHDFRTSADVDWIYMGLELTNDSGSNWTNLSYAAGNNGYGDGDTTYHLSCQTSIFDITNVSTQKMRFYVERQTGTVTTQGNSNRNQTGFDIFRLGDT